MRRSRHRRDLLPALACDAGKARRGERRRDLRYPASLSRCLGPRRRPHAAWFADRIEAGGFWAGILRSERLRRKEGTASLNKRPSYPRKRVSSTLRLHDSSPALWNTGSSAFADDDAVDVASLRPTASHGAYEDAEALPA